MRTFFPFQNSHGQTSNKRCYSSSYHSHFNMENPEESVISETSKHLKGLNTVYVRNSVQRTTWRRLRMNKRCLGSQQIIPRQLQHTTKNMQTVRMGICHTTGILNCR